MARERCSARNKIDARHTRNSSYRVKRSQLPGNRRIRTNAQAELIFEIVDFDLFILFRVHIGISRSNKFANDCTERVMLAVQANTLRQSGGARHDAWLS